MSRISIAIESGSVEARTVTLRADEDPTGNLPEFGLVVPANNESGDDVTSWVEGAWSGAYDTDTGYIEAITPTLGAGAAALALDEAVRRYSLWVRVGTVVRFVCTVIVT